MTFPVLVLPSAAASRGARERSVASLAAQSIAVVPCASLREVPADAHGYVGLLLAGAELDATACERAAWFLASHAALPCVAGAVANPAEPAVTLASALQFVVVRAPLVRQLLREDDALDGATAAGLLIACRGASGRGAGWVADPLVRTSADAAEVARLAGDARALLSALGLDEKTLFDGGAGGVPVAPQQTLVQVPWPDVRVQRARSDGLRILALLQGFPMGGYTAFNADLLPRLVAAGHAVTTCTTELLRTDWRLDRVRAVAPDIHHPHAVVPPPAVPAYIDWLIASREIDVVLLSHSFLGFHVLPYLRARHPRVAFVDYVHTEWFETGMYGSYATMATRFASQLDAQLATSEALARELVTHGCDAGAVRVAHIGIDTTTWRHEGPRLDGVRRQLGASDDTLVLLFSGRLSPEKRPHFAVAVLAQLRAEGHDAVLVFAGGGPLLMVTHDLAVAMGVEPHCKFLGELDEAMLREVYAASDVFLAPSEIEGISRSLYEAMAMGCVPVVSDVGGQRELVVPGTGSLVDASCREAAPYLDGVRPWLDRAARRAASVAARAHIVAHFDSRRTVARVGETLELAVARRAQHQECLPPAMAEEMAVLSIEVIRRHVLHLAGRA